MSQNTAPTTFTGLSIETIEQWITNAVAAVYWRLPFGAVIIVPWPSVPSSDPNDVWREYLELQVGQQRRSWDWKIWKITEYGSNIAIKFRRKKDAVMFALRYGN